MISHFYSDPHFGHGRICELAGRGDLSVEEMDALLVRRYNSTVREGDTVLWLGDCFFHDRATAKRLMGLLHGNKIVIPGNHDRSPTWLHSIGFAAVLPQQTLVGVFGWPVYCSHYPPAYAAPGVDKRDFAKSLQPRVKGRWYMHGHTHSKLQIQGQAIHVGCDAWWLRPASMVEVHRLICRRQ